MERREAMQILGLKEGFSESEEKRAYRRIAMICHPDQGGTDGLFAVVNEAHSILKVVQSHCSPNYQGNPSSQEKPKQERTEQQKRQKPSWDDIPWNQIFLSEREFRWLVLEGRNVSTYWNGWRILLSPHNLIDTPIRTEIPLRYTEKIWNKMNPFLSKENKGEIELRNVERDPLTFGVNGMLSLGLQKFSFEFMGKRKTFWFLSFKKAKTYQRKILVKGKKNITVNIKFVFSGKE